MQSIVYITQTLTTHLVEELLGRLAISNLLLLASKFSLFLQNLCLLFLDLFVDLCTLRWLVALRQSLVKNQHDGHGREAYATTGRVGSFFNCRVSRSFSGSGSFARFSSRSNLLAIDRSSSALSR
jgi:hypothetical protein